MQTTVDSPESDTEDYVRARRGARKLGVSIATWWRMVSDGRLPQPIRLGPGITLWRWRDVEARLAELERAQNVPPSYESSRVPNRVHGRHRSRKR